MKQSVIHASRIGAVLLRHPVEGFDRILAVIDERRDRPAMGKVDYEVESGWNALFHEALGVEDCEERGGFLELSDRLATEMEAGYVDADADPAFARAVWCAVSHLRPEHVVETGVARGVTSRFILEALEANASGHLWSIDVPPLGFPSSQPYVAVPERLRHRWTLLRGVSRRRLPPLLSKLGRVDVFVHDSLHTERNMLFEFEEVWPRLEPGGVLIADDIDQTRAFARFRFSGSAVQLAVAEDVKRSSAFGLVVKSGTT